MPPVKHKFLFAPCRMTVVYQLPFFASSYAFTGKTGCWLNISLSDHKYSLEGNIDSHVAWHCLELQYLKIAQFFLCTAISWRGRWLRLATEKKRNAVCGRALRSHARQWIFIFELLNKAVNQPYLHCLACFASHPCCLPPANHGSLEVDTLKQAKLLIRPWSQSNNKRVSCHLNEREHSCLHVGAVSKYDGAPFLAVKCWSVEKKGT